MYKLCKTKQSAERQAHIAQCLLELLCECPYAQVTVSALCRRAGVPRKAFYRYFDGKDDVLDAVVDRQFALYESFSAERSADGAVTAEAELTRFFRFWKENRIILEALRRSGIVDVVVCRIVDRLCEGTSWTYRLACAHPCPERRTVLVFLIEGLFAVVMDWARRGFDRSERELAAETARILTRPIFPERGAQTGSG